MHLSDTVTVWLQFFEKVIPKFLYPLWRIARTAMRWPGSVRYSEDIIPWSSLQSSFYFWSLSWREDKRWQERLSLSVDSVLPGQRLPAHGGALGLCECRGQSRGPLLSHSISSVEQGSAALVEILLHLDHRSHTFKSNSTSRCQWEL